MNIHTNCSYADYLRAQNETRFKFHTVDNEQITNIINKLKNKYSCGHDNIPNKLIKRSKEALVEPITILINQMLQTGQFPNELKLSKVKPLFKSGDSSLFSNYVQYHYYRQFQKSLNMCYSTSYLIISQIIIYSV